MSDKGRQIKEIHYDEMYEVENELLKRKLEIAVNHLDSIGKDLCLEPIRLSTLAKEALKEIEAMS